MSKLGMADRFYSLTQKGEEFAKALETWCSERGITPEEIPKFLACVVSRSRDFEWERISWKEAYEELVDKGYLDIKEVQKVGEAKEQ